MGLYAEKPILDFGSRLAVVNVEGADNLKKCLNELTPGKHVIHYVVSKMVWYFIEFENKIDDKHEFVDSVIIWEDNYHAYSLRYNYIDSEIHLFIDSGFTSKPLDKETLQIGFGRLELCFLFSYVLYAICPICTTKHKKF